MPTRNRHDRPAMTPRGRGLLAASAIAVAAGTLSGGNLLVELGLLGLVVIAAARVLCLRNVRGLRIRRALPAAVFSGDDFDVEITLQNPRRAGAAREIAVTDRMLPFHDGGVSAAMVAPGGEVVERFRTRVVGRGRMEGLRYRIESGFPLGLFHTSRRRRGRESVLVYPRPVLPSALRAIGAEAGDDGGGGVVERELAGDIHGVREFQHGDPLKHVLWPVFARSGKLVVREFDRPRPERYSLLFHSYCPPGKLIWPEAFEHALSLLSGLLFLCRERGVPLDLCAPFTGWERLEVSDPARLAEPLEALALARHQPEKDLAAVSAALRALPGRHPVFVVSEAPVRYWADQLPAGHRVLTCLDNTTLRIRRPSLSGFRRVA